LATGVLNRGAGRWGLPDQSTLIVVYLASELIYVAMSYVEVFGDDAAV
jgi:hypothetical protein